MSDGFTLRPPTAEDAAQLAELGRVSVDGGAVAFRLVTHVATDGEGRGRSIGVVAVDSRDGRIVGSARMMMDTCWYEGERRPFVLLRSLMVHPEHRRRGVAAALGRWRIEQAEAAAGPDVVVIADIQKGNTASLAAARRWATAFTPPALSVPVPMRARPPRPVAGLEIRAPRVEELAAIVARVEEATGEQNFARDWTADSLSAWLGWSPLDVPVHHYRVAVERDGSIVAGLALREEGLLRTMELVRMPPTIRLLNAVLHVVPADGRLRNLSVEHLWSAPGRTDAARALWDDTRWSWRDRGSNLLITLDPRDPVAAVLRRRPWTPTTSIVTAVRARPAPTPERIVAPVV